MAHAFPYRFEPQESGGVLVQFIDVPEAHTSGATEADAGGDNALDCLIAALGGYIRLGREIPRPSPARGRPVVIPPPLVSAKLALYEALRAQRMTRTELARRLGLQENAVRRLLDLDHRSHIDHVGRALAALGKRLEVRVLEPA
jgi:antitoxin HicB